ncbi:hypothetical protein SPOG_03642 [Schizosaccharomyces cryophilus OY26]|uniref:Uncharacterized protein n=1 Tax=Schizosaccharomyces cryophilus (strain OY26 / ATCC MYA-4695 / CBS 11777 / NBRC 106824 / NRRL Y48691) TaxID=653667 RepID=S9XHE8_SCHCR|nr:uncharacterized protein SPOG_03642 [Schizosaccharomyces cryophilus OY26]EPY53101.1 hypothetical protein SPOG_03642 [Schizosaccharomyces cryophilus OY26]
MKGNAEFIEQGITHGTSSVLIPQFQCYSITKKHVLEVTFKVDFDINSDEKELH